MPRTVRRRSTKKTVKPAKSEAKKRTGTFYELWAICFCALAIFLFAAVGSHAYSLGRVEVISEISGVAENNAMGPLGHFVAVLLFGALGWSSLFIVAWFLVAAAYCWLSATQESFDFRIKSFKSLALGVFGSLLVLSTLSATFAGLAGGGNVGQALITPLLQSFNLSGALLIQITLLLLFIAFATELTITKLVLKGAKGLILSLKVIVLTIPTQTYRYVAKWMSSLYAYLSEFISPRIDDDQEQEVASSKKAAPKPKVRKNVIEHKEQQEIVVRRREDSKASKALAKNIKALTKARKRSAEEEDDSNYESPDLSLLTAVKKSKHQEDDKTLLKKSQQIEDKLADFNVKGKITEVHPGPIITMFEFEPAAGVKVGKIASLQDDLAMSLKASAIRIIAPIPGKGTVGIEVPNQHRDIVRLREVLESKDFFDSESLLNIPLGKDIYGDPVVADIATMPHLLMAGATGTGKSVSINAILLSLLYRCSPSELGLILIDPKILELSIYEGIPHLRAPVVTVPKQAKAVLEWAVKEMNKRYRMMQRYGVRNIDGFNRMVAGVSEEEHQKKIKDKGVLVLDETSILEEGTIDPDTKLDDAQEFQEQLKPLPKIVIVIDEMADLMLSVGREVEDLVARLAQKARAAGIHLILATQRPSVDVITGLIKANFPARISFRVSSRIDSRTILDSMGAEKLLGKGDMLMMMPGAHHLTRIHGAYVSDSEVSKVINALKKNSRPRYDSEIIDYCERAMEEDSQKGSDSNMEYDELYDQTLQLIVEKGQASTSMIQRAFRIGYNRAARIMDTLEKEGVIGPMDGSKPREVLVHSHDLEERGAT